MFALNDFISYARYSVKIKMIELYYVAERTVILIYLFLCSRLFLINTKLW